MIGSATGFCKRASVMAVAGCLMAAPLSAQDAPPEPVKGQSPDVQEVAMTPLRDLNLAKDPIPEVLIRASAAPYAGDGMKQCAAIGADIAELDAVLGPDLDIAEGDDDRISVGRLARSAVGSLLPFRGIVRELTGAADHQREFEQAIYAGSIRRGYLKGLGQQKGCAYPARPAFAAVNVTKADRIDTDKGRERVAQREERAEDGTVFVSQPVVQSTDE